MAQLLGGAGHLHWAGLIAAFVQVVLIDLTLAGDNAIAVGMAAAGLPQPRRRHAIALGLAGAVVLLCGLAYFAVSLLKSGGGGLVLGGGLMLLLISWQMWRDIRARRPGRHRADDGKARRDKTLLRALTQIFIADISTSMDNVLAVAGVVRDQPIWVLFAGLALSVVLTGFAAVGVARLLHRWPWIGYIGLVVVISVAGRMVWDGAAQLGWIG
ncbi:MAG TPA: YjbE family putative metal transport protein [Caulobacteraceae bacterium]|nr:YjbE family putative metal transport protein [Caulobacteraceae bacterium]